MRIKEGAIIPYSEPLARETSLTSGSFFLPIPPDSHLLLYFCVIIQIEMELHHGTDNLHLVNPVVTIGSFDGVHKGHTQVITSLKQVAERLGGETVIISFEPHPREVLYPLEKRPGILTTLEEKAAILEQLGIQHLVILPFTRALAELTYVEFVRDLLVDGIGVKGLVIGYDHRFGKNREGTFEKLAELAKQYDFYLEQEKVYTENDINISSTKIRNALQIGDLRQVNEFLGYTYAFRGKVIPGDRIGRTLGFPTANLVPEDERKLLPAGGVYAVQVEAEGKVYGGMLNIGVRPTVSCTGKMRIEVNLFDFEGDLYGESLRVALIARIRGEQKFDGKAELAAQLERDREEARARLKKENQA